MTTEARTPSVADEVEGLTRAAQHLHHQDPRRFAPALKGWRWFEVDHPIGRAGEPRTPEWLTRLADEWWRDHATPVPFEEVADRIAALATLCQAYGNVTCGELSWLLYCVKPADAASTAFWSECLGRLRRTMREARPGR